MGFYYENEKKSELVYDSRERAFGRIEIINNEEISFDLKGFIDIPHQSYIHKITADFGDGCYEVIVKPIKSENKNWMKFSHRFAFKEDIKEGDIEINVYNLYGESATLIIPFQVKQQSLKEQNIEFRLVSANLCNDKKISYVFNNINKNQLILAKNR